MRYFAMPKRRAFLQAMSLLPIAALPAMGAGIPNTLHLTYDDGPHPRLTPILLDVLAIYDMRATFFVVGRSIRGNERILQRMISDGHAIGNHTWDHPDLTKVEPKRVRSEISRTNEAILSVTGVRPTLFRPPYGALSSDVRRTVREEFGLSMTMWDLDTMDWKRPGAEVVRERVRSGARPGIKVLMHDIHPQTVDAAPLIMADLANSGLKSVPL